LDVAKGHMLEAHSWNEMVMEIGGGGRQVVMRGVRAPSYVGASRMCNPPI